MSVRNLIIILVCFLCSASLFAKDVIVISNPPVAEGITQGEFMDWSCFDGCKPFDPGMDPVDTLWWTGNIDRHVFGGQTLTYNPDLPQIDGVYLQIKYGLWNDPPVNFMVTVNGTFVGSFWANWGYISPGPRYVKVNISNFIVAGPDLIEISAAVGGGEAVIGYVGAGMRQTDTRIASGVEENPLMVLKFKLYDPSPNPFNATTYISYSLKEMTHISFLIYDITGREVYSYRKENEAPGRYSLMWDASDLASGVYVIAFEAGSYRNIKKAVLLK